MPKERNLKGVNKKYGAAKRVGITRNVLTQVFPGRVNNTGMVGKPSLTRSPSDPELNVRPAFTAVFHDTFKNGKRCIDCTNPSDDIHVLNGPIKMECPEQQEDGSVYRCTRHLLLQEFKENRKRHFSNFQQPFESQLPVNPRLAHITYLEQWRYSWNRTLGNTTSIPLQKTSSTFIPNSMFQSTKVTEPQMPSSLIYPPTMNLVNNSADNKEGKDPIASIDPSFKKEPKPSLNIPFNDWIVDRPIKDNPIDELPTNQILIGQANFDSKSESVCPDYQYTKQSGNLANISSTAFAENHEGFWQKDSVCAHSLAQVQNPKVSKKDMKRLQDIEAICMHLRDIEVPGNSGIVKGPVSFEDVFEVLGLEEDQPKLQAEAKNITECNMVAASSNIQPHSDTNKNQDQELESSDLFQYLGLDTQSIPEMLPSPGYQVQDLISWADFADEDVGTGKEDGVIYYTISNYGSDDWTDFSDVMMSAGLPSAPQDVGTEKEDAMTDGTDSSDKPAVVPIPFQGAEDFITFSPGSDDNTNLAVLPRASQFVRTGKEDAMTDWTDSSDGTLSVGPPSAPLDLHSGKEDAMTDWTDSADKTLTAVVPRAPQGAEDFMTFSPDSDDNTNLAVLPRASQFVRTGKEDAMTDWTDSSDSAITVGLPSPPQDVHTGKENAMTNWTDSSDGTISVGLQGMQLAAVHQDADIPNFDFLDNSHHDDFDLTDDECEEEVSEEEDGEGDADSDWIMESETESESITDEE